MATISPNMNLVISAIGVDSGFNWETNLNASLSIVDGHNHTSGRGVQIPSNGLNINSDLTFQSSNAIDLRSTRFAPQSAVLSELTDLDCLYVAGVDLYYNDGIGNNVRITQSGGVAGSPGSIANLTSPASASYVAINKTFVWQSDSNTPASMDFASAILRNDAANSKGLVLSPPLAMAADYQITLPALPVSTSLLTIASTGEMGTTSYPIPQAGLASDSVGTAQLIDGSVTKAKIAAIGQQVSSSSGNFTTGSTSYVDVTNLTVTITTTGKPVALELIPDGSSDAFLSSIGSGLGFTSSAFKFVRASTDIGSFGLSLSIGGSSAVSTISPTGLSMKDVIGAGIYTYKLQAKSAIGCTTGVGQWKLFAYELS